MSCPDLPPEMLNSIVDFLYGETKTLRQYCLVSKSWVPRARKHLFAVIAFFTQEDIDAWKKTFLDPSDSPARYTRTLVVNCAEVVTAADTVEGGWVPTFSHIVRFVMNSEKGLPPFLKLPPTLRSLSLAFFSLPISGVLTLIHSLPFLEDLTLIGDDAHLDNGGSDGPQIFAPSTPPALTGTLELEVGPGVEDLTRRLLDLPGGLHFRGLNLRWNETGGFHHPLESAAALSGTLEHLIVAYGLGGGSALSPIDLSKVTKLKDIVFRCQPLEVEWITSTLETITPEHRDFQQISVIVDHVYVLVKTDAGIGWPDLDRVLVRFWESHSIRTKFIGCIEYWSGVGGVMDLAMRLLPESTRRRIIDPRELPLLPNM